MKTKTKKGKKGSAKKSTSRPINEATGFRVGAFNNLAAQAYLKSKTREEAIRKIAAAATAYYKGKKSKDPAAHANREAHIFTNLLPKLNSRLFKKLPSSAKPAKKAAKKTTKRATKKVVKASPAPATQAPAHREAVAA